MAVVGERGRATWSELDADVVIIAFGFQPEPPEWLAAHGIALPGLNFRQVEGYLRGFIDLVYEHEGRTYVVDYKSNWLGPEPEDYRAERLPGAMDAAGYRLQYLLYCVAVTRHLRSRRRGWTYADGFGGVRYLFLRGLDPARGPTHGIHADCPTAELIAALDAYLDGGERR